MKYDAKILARYGIDVAPIDDTMLMSYAMHAGCTGTAWTRCRALSRPPPIPIKELIGSGKSADHLRPGGDRRGRALCRRGCRHHAAAVAPVQAAAAPGAGDDRLRDAGTPAGAGAGADGDGRHQGGPRHAEPHVERLCAEDGGARGRDPRAGGRDVQRRLAQAAGRDPVRQDGPPGGKKGKTGPIRPADVLEDLATSTTCPRACWTGGSCRS
jgi:hypothetical protein